jgi:hypothetical protein
VREEVTDVGLRVRVRVGRGKSHREANQAEQGPVRDSKRNSNLIHSESRHKNINRLVSLVHPLPYIPIHHLPVYNKKLIPSSSLLAAHHVNRINPLRQTSPRHLPYLPRGLRRCRDRTTRLWACHLRRMSCLYDRFRTTTKPTVPTVPDWHQLGPGSRR